MEESKKLYLIFSHGDQDSDFGIDYATSELSGLVSWAEKYELELDTDLLESMSYQDLGFEEWSERHYHAYAFDMKASDGMELFALCANGNEVYNWIGAVEGVFYSRDEARRALIKMTDLEGICFSDEEKIGRELKHFDTFGIYVDSYWTYWQCMPFHLD